MNISLENGRVLVGCPRCNTHLALGPPRHKITVGLTAGLTVTPAAMCPGCAHVFDVRRGEVRSLGQYKLPPARTAYEPQVGRVSPAGITLTGGGMGELAELAHIPETQAGPAPAPAEPEGQPEPEVVAEPVTPEPDTQLVLGEPSDFTPAQLRKRLSEHHLEPKGNKATMLARLREHHRKGCDCGV